jgi:hypothetical protein
MNPASQESDFRWARFNIDLVRPAPELDFKNSLKDSFSAGSVDPKSGKKVPRNDKRRGAAAPSDIHKS